MPPPRHLAPVLVLSLALLASAGCAGRPEVTTRDGGPLPVAARAEITTDGAVRVDPAPPGTTPSLERTVHSETGAPPAPAVRVRGDALAVDARCGDGCYADLVLRLPAGAPVRVDSTGGAIAVTGTGAVELRTQAGAVSADHVAGDAVASSQAGAVSVADAQGGRVSVTSQAGAVAATRVAGPVEASAEAGRVVVDELVPADVSARSSAGDVTITVPPAAYRVEARDIDGVQTGVPDDTTGRWTLRAESTAGQVQLRAR